MGRDQPDFASLSLAWPCVEEPQHCTVHPPRLHLPLRCSIELDSSWVRQEGPASCYESYRRSPDEETLQAQTSPLKSPRTQDIIDMP